MDLRGPDFSSAPYWTEFDEHGERLVMPIRKSWKVVGLALAGFAFASFQHLGNLRDGSQLVDWLWALLVFAGALHLISNMLTSILAREVLRVDAGYLVHGWRMFGLRRERRYLLRDIRGLTAADDEQDSNKEQLISPLKDFGKIGSVRFNLGQTTVRIGAVLDEAHGQQVVRWIARRAPGIVFDY